MFLVELTEMVAYLVARHRDTSVLTLPLNPDIYRKTIGHIVWGPERHQEPFSVSFPQVPNYVTLHLVFTHSYYWSGYQMNT